MHVVTVTFECRPEHAGEFHAAVRRQAENSLAREEHCRRFDVCTDPSSASRVFLYELYSDEAAFRAHLASDHFASFSATVEPWLVSKTVETWTLA